MNTYNLSAAAEKRLESLVDAIEADPGDMVDPREFEERQATLDVRQVLATLPEGMSEDDFAGILKLALLTECATDTYAREIGERARLFKAGWLERFNDRVWTPDEMTHSDPFKLILLNMGFSEEELDREIRETQEREFIHYGGDTPVHVTTFGMVQEYLTDNWHGLIGRLLKKGSPDAAYMANRIKKRETLHTLWYRDMTALQVEADPRYIVHVADEVNRFRMPGNSLVPELQLQVPRWLPLMGADFERIMKDMLRLVHESLGSSVRNTGEFVINLAAEKGVRIGPFSGHHLHFAMNRLGGPGYGLLGEALLQRAGLSYLFRPAGERPKEDPPAERIRTLLRSWVASHLPVPNLEAATA